MRKKKETPKQCQRNTHLSSRNKKTAYTVHLHLDGCRARLKGLSPKVPRKAKSATHFYQPAMLRVRSCSGQVLCTIDPAARKNKDALVLDDLTLTVGSQLHVPAHRISIHAADGHKPPSPTMTWADCQQPSVTEDQELLAVVRHFRDGGAPELSLAIEKQQHEEVCSLLESLVDPNIAISHDKSYGPCTPLCIAAYTNFGEPSLAQALIAAHANLDGKHVAISPLTAACEARNMRMVNFLLEADADVNRPTWFMDTPLLIAVSMDSAPLVRLLIRHRANIRQQDRWQRGPIERAFPAQGAPCGRVPRACKCTSPAVHGHQLPAARGRKQRQHHVDQATSASRRRPSRQRRKRSLSRERASTLANLSAAPTAEAHPVPNKPRAHSQHIHKVLKVRKAPRRAQKMPCTALPNRQLQVRCEPKKKVSRSDECLDSCSCTAATT